MDGDRERGGLIVNCEAWTTTTKPVDTTCHNDPGGGVLLLLHLGPGAGHQPADLLLHPHHGAAPHLHARRRHRALLRWSEFSEFSFLNVL